MARDVRVKLSLRGINRLMRSQPVQAEVNKTAGRIAAGAGPKFQVHPSPHKWTGRAFVEPVKGERIGHGDRERLLSALDAGPE